jgi:phage terminase large subunit-like protein
VWARAFADLEDLCAQSLGRDRRDGLPDRADDRSDPPAWQDPKNWWMVTPNRDRSVSIPQLEKDWEKAKLKGQGEIVRWASQHLNIEIGLPVTDFCLMCTLASLR